MGLLTIIRDTSGNLVSLDAHPLLRKHFAKQFRTEHFSTDHYPSWLEVNEIKLALREHLHKNDRSHLDSPKKPFRLYVNYAHKSLQRTKRLLNALSPYERNGLIEILNEKAIKAGDNWAAVIDQAMNQAHGAIVVLDSDFLNSSSCMGEVEHLLQRYLRVHATSQRACALKP